VLLPLKKNRGNPRSHRRPLRRRCEKALAFLLLTLAFSAPPPPARAQGCAQCRDNTAAMPERTRAAYRHAILLMISTAGALFAGTVVLFKRQR